MKLLHCFLALPVVTLVQISLASAQTSPHGDLQMACMRCHTTTSWDKLRTPLEFDHDSTGFALRDQHANVPCDQCHKDLVFAKAPSQCTSCHMDVHRGELGAQCERCHTTKSWLVPDMRQRHSQTRFTLLGAHMTAPCQECHVNQQKFEYVNVSSDCVTCHRPQYDATAAPAHRAAGFGTNCIECHSPSALAWPSAFDHSVTGFALVGAHTTTPCAQCHASARFKNTPTQCDNCHHAQFLAATNPNHAANGFSTACQSCHTSVTWQQGTFNHNVTNFPLTGAHASAQCTACHKNGTYAAIPTTCVSCHQADFNATNNPPHASGGFSTDCTTCHSTTNWTGATFDHSKSSFPLTGAHASVACVTCHTNNNFTTLPITCVGCHQANFTAASNPPHAAGGFSSDCTTCHTTTVWQPSNFNHSTTKFPLTGAHATVTPCTNCHKTTPWTAQAMACVSCHQADYNATNNPPHASAGYSTDCVSCHATTAWTGAVFDHSKASFPLTGAHVSVPCASCHLNNIFTTAPTTCVGCHQANFTAASNPPHTVGGFSSDCTTCHTTTAWQPSNFNHSTTKFPLTGAHATVTPCTNCHKTTPWSAQAMTCVSCHQADFNATNNPPHASSGFSTDCTTCHTTTAWTGAVFDHTKASFPLTGAHVSVPCASCHPNNIFTTAPTTCVGCHQANFTAASNPPHTAGGFSSDCTTCHNTTVWQPSTFNHSTTKFPLTGAHATVTPCTNCHKITPWSAQATTCVSCHQADFNGTTNPPHVSGGFPTDCTTCHSTTNWSGATFDHSKSSFPLVGAHVSVPCASCHTNNNFTTVPTTCVGCHQANFTAASNPPHTAGGLSSDCTTCHTTTVWQPSTFSHSTTKFPLTGAHAAVAPCTSCHTASPWSAQATTCVSCHQANFNAATNPPHTAGGFSSDCTTCHNTTVWQPSTFNHSTTKFPLTGAHATVTPCTNCHKITPWSAQATTCVSCHQADYNATTNPVHSTAGFPTTCETCHATTAWTGATFNHTWFPTNHGRANGVCATCHTNANDYSAFTCMNGGCHPQSSTNSNHTRVSGYQYVASACYNCHPRGNGG